jgi:uncharacterized protein (DUF924 family)
MRQHNPTRTDVDPDAQRVLDFWFGALVDGFADAVTRKRWFASDPEFDRECARNFASLVDAAADGNLKEWLSTPRGRLAYVIVTDQFTRQIHRGSLQAYATDAFALAAAKDGVARGDDLELAGDERAFFYLPFEHSESRIDQHAAVGLFTHLVATTSLASRALCEEWLRFAIGHRDIVLRFGRFPHRNATLGREPTDDEVEFLKRASRFGQ